MAGDLASKKCVPCEGGVKPFTQTEIQDHLRLVSGWQVVEEKKIRKEMKFRDFAALMKFVDRMAQLAESEGHHPDFFVSYSQLIITIWTHAIGGLSENDFILAKKLDNLAVS